MIRTFVRGSAALVLFASGAHAKERFEPTWESVGVKNDAPEWLQDAKFGIYTHWGMQTHLGDCDVSRSIWYYGQMYLPKSPVFEYHKKTFGDQHQVGYKDLLDKFKAKDFDAEAWADTFYEAGARFGGMVVIHRDNVAMWDSDLTPYNVADLGPRRDITGELAEAYRAKGMRFIATFHSLGSWNAFLGSYDYDAKGGQAVELYSEPHEKDDPIARSFVERHLGFTREVITKYKPDGIWFDYGLKHALNEEDRLNLFADYYNWGEKNGQDVFVAHKHGDQIPSGILDTERGRRGSMLEKTWMNDESIGIRYWFQNRERFKLHGNFSGKYLTHAIIDLASKNGTFLLNVAPDKHGVIPPDQLEVLNAIGAWLKRYGEAIYSTRPWETYGEGPFQRKWPGKISGKAPKFGYVTEDIRFTCSKDGKTIYAIFMGPPKPNIPIHSMVTVDPVALKDCRWVGHGPIRVEAYAQGPPFVDTSTMQGDASTEFGYAIAIPAAAVRYNARASAGQDRLDLSVDVAQITGTSIRLESIDDDDGIRALRSWTNPEDSLSWTVQVPAAGTWGVEVLTRAGEPSRLAVELANEAVEFAVPAKGRPRKPWTVNAGSLTVAKQGSHTVTVKAVKTGNDWAPVDIYGLKLKQHK